MMRDGYLAAICPNGPAQARREKADIEAALPPSFHLVLETGGLLLFSNRSAAFFTDPAGAIVGEIFARGRKAPSRSLGADEWLAIGRSGGRVLIEAYWGAYVAFVVRPDGAILLRGPFGDLGCYFSRSRDAVLVASDLTLLLKTAKLIRRIDEKALARHIAYPEWRSSETCLDGVAELRGGHCLHVGPARIERSSIWSPWRFIREDMQFSDPQDAVGRVRDAVRVGGAARTTGRQCLLLLSGGLDSAILAATLAGEGVNFGCLNLIANDAASDERRYANLVAGSLDVDLETRRFELEKTDVRRSAAANMPYPVHRCFTQALDDVAAEVARAYHADLIVDGGGGDNVFFGSRSVSILADCLLTSGLDQRFWKASRALGDLAQTGMVTLLRMALLRAWHRSRPPRLEPNTAYLSGDARAVVAAGERHPWFTPPPGVLPGRATHVALLTPAQNLVEAFQAQARYPSISPLASQPVVETCLRVPSWLWIAPGRNRAVARSAFRKNLPLQIIDRRSKGSPTHFVAEIFESNRSVIREMLGGGALADAGLIDRDAVVHALDDSGPTRDHRFVQIMGLVDAEAWARAQH